MSSLCGFSIALRSSSGKAGHPGADSRPALPRRSPGHRSSLPEILIIENTWTHFAVGDLLTVNPCKSLSFPPNSPFHSLVACALWLALLTGVQADGRPGDDAYKKLRNADGLARKGRAQEASKTYLEAVQLYNKALEADPDNRSFRQNHLYCLDKSALVLIKQADSLRKAGNFSEATVLYAGAIERYEDVHSLLKEEKFSGNIEYARVHGRSSAFKDALARKAPAPELELPVAGGSEQTLKLSDYRGTFVLLEFFASWCKSCVESAPQISKLQGDIRKDDLTVIRVCLDEVTGFKRRGQGLAAFLRALPADHLVALGTDETSEYYAVESVPTRILIDRKGNLVRQITHDADLRHEVGSIIQANMEPEENAEPVRTGRDRDDVSDFLKEAVDGKTLRTIKGLRYQPGISTPYSGWVKGTHQSGNVAALMQYKDGKAHGLAMRWDRDGKKIAEGAFRENKMDGVWTEWHENGQKRGESRYRNGRIDGRLTLWRADGTKIAEGAFRDGKEISRTWWNSQGSVVETEEEAMK